MPRTVVVGVDGTPESRTAAEWAAEEALRRGAVLHLVQAWERRPHEYTPLAGVQSPLPPRGTPRLPRDGPEDDEEPPLVAVRRDVERAHPEMPVTTEDVSGQAVPALLDAAREAGLLVLGSRRLGAVTGFLVGSVALGVVARAARPVVLVGQGDEAVAPGAVPPQDVVLGLDLQHPAEALIDFAFEAAARRGARLRVVHGWSPPPYPRGEAPGAQADRVHKELTEVLRAPRLRFPGVDVGIQAVAGKAATHLVDASHDAALLVVGRRVRRSRVGGHIGCVAHMVLHHTRAPVAVVPHE
jgi:nucleotide-binding universal stress UspA family protein